MPEADTTYTSRSSQSINPKLNLTSLSLEQLLLMKLDLPVLSSRAKTLLSFKKERLLPSEMEPSRSSSLTSLWKLISLEESLLKMLKSRLPTQLTTSLKNKSKEDPEDQEEKVKTDHKEEKEITKEDPEEKVRTDNQEEMKTEATEDHQSNSPRLPPLSQEMRDSTFSER